MDAARRYHRQWKRARRRRALAIYLSGFIWEGQIVLGVLVMAWVMWMWGVKLWFWLGELWLTNCMLIILKYGKEMLPPFC